MADAETLAGFAETDNADTFDTIGATVLAPSIRRDDDAPRRDDRAAPTLTSTRQAVNAPDLARGATLGRYVVLDRLGAGGMGVVFAAYSGSQR